MNHLTLGEIVDAGRGQIKTGPFGSQLHRSDYIIEGTPIVMPKHIVSGKVDTTGIARIGEIDLHRLSQHRLKPGDIVYGRRGDIGRHAFITERENGWLCGTGCIRITLCDGPVGSLFLHYYLSAVHVIDWISNQAIGATMPNLNTSILRSLPVSYPPLPTQCKIASILSAYDDLIENNLRRIKILEEMAQNLYSEWFVKFRFPEHENAMFIDSPFGMIPKGWEVSKLGEYLINLESGKRPKGGVSQISSGVPSIGAENIKGIGVHDYSSEKYVPRDFYKSMKKGVHKDTEVALYKDGAYIGRSSYFRDNFPYSEFCVNEHVFLMRSKGVCMTQNQLYLWLREGSTVSQIHGTNANSAQPGINQKGVRGLSILVPTEEFASQFDELVDPYLAHIISLAKHNKILRESRDLLLPRLISGELDVSELDIEVPEDTA